MSLSKQVSFDELNIDIFEIILKYLKFDELVRFERVNSFWEEAIGSLLNRRKTLDYHSCTGMATCEKGGHNDRMLEWFSCYLPYDSLRTAYLTILEKMS